MYLTPLTTHMMLNLTARWLNDSDFVQSLQDAGPLGQGMFEQLSLAHNQLADIDRRRAAADASLQALIASAGEVDGVHDRKARSLFHHFDALIDGTDDPKLAASYQDLQARLFPQGLRVTRLPYIEEGGAAVALDRSTDTEVRTKLASIQVGEQTMLNLFEAWIQAGHELGELVTARANLQVELSRERSDAGLLDIKSSRGRWLQAVRGLLWAIGADEKIAKMADRIRAPLERALNDVQRRRAGQNPDELDAGGGVDEVDGIDDPFTEGDESADTELADTELADTELAS